MFANKLVAVINKDLEPGVAMNALAHMTIGLGTSLSKDGLRLTDYKDQSGNIYPNISEMPFIILRGKSNEIKKSVLAAREQKILHGAFIETMTGGTYQEQLENTLKTSEDNIVFYGCVLFGPIEQVQEITKKLSLYR